MSVKGKENFNNFLEDIKKCPRIIYFGRTFCSLQWNLLAGLTLAESGGYRIAGKRRVGALEYLKSAGLTVEQLAEIYIDQYETDPYQLTWETLVKRRGLYMFNTDGWVKLAKLLDQEINVYRGIPPNGYDEFDPMYTVFPNGRVRRLIGIWPEIVCDIYQQYRSKINQHNIDGEVIENSFLQEEGPSSFEDGRQVIQIITDGGQVLFGIESTKTEGKKKYVSRDCLIATFGPENTNWQIFQTDTLVKGRVGTPSVVSLFDIDINNLASVIARRHS